LCSAPQEAFHHVFHCPHLTHDNQDLLLTLKTRCYKFKSTPALVEILIKGLSSWLDQHPIEVDNDPPEYSALVAAQTPIGWLQVFHGRISQQWSIIQQDHFVQ
jgi:hypothetical protein